MKTLFLFITIVAAISIGCSTTGHYTSRSWAKTNYDEAHNDCTVKDRIATHGEQPDWNYFMLECMRGQGYDYVVDQSCILFFICK